jgi:hypothetical protein
MVKSKVLYEKIQSFCRVNLKFKYRKPFIILKFNYFIQYQIPLP